MAASVAVRLCGPVRQILAPAI